MAIVGEDHFTDTAGTALASHIMDVGGGGTGSWTLLAGSMLIAVSGGVRNNTAARSEYANNVVAPSTRQRCGCVFTARTLITGFQTGLIMGVPTSGTNQDGYEFQFNATDTAGNGNLVFILRGTAGTATTLATFPYTGFTLGTTKTVVGMRDTSNNDTIWALNGTPIVLIRDATVTRNGRLGIASGSVQQTSGNGINPTDWWFDDPTSDSPTNSVRPTITGTVTVGSVLTCNPNTWSAGDTNTFQWFSLDASGTGTHFTAIAGANQSTYTIQSTDAGKTLLCVVLRSTGALASNLVGSGFRATASTTTVAYPAPTNLTRPTLSGAGISGSNATRGIAINTTNGTWDVQDSLAYRWQKSTNGGGTYVDIGGATSSSYIPIQADIGALVRSAVDATYHSVGPTTAFSDPVTIVPPAPTNITPPSISGTGFVGDLHTVSSTGSWNDSPTSFAYQWVESTDGGSTYNNVGGAVSNQYTPGNTETGRLLAVMVTAINAGGNSTPIRSNSISLAASFSSATVTIGLTGGSSNNDPRASTGGFRSTAVPNVAAVANAVLQNVSAVQAFAGYTDYIAVAVRNTSSVDTWDNAIAWLTIPTTSPDDEVYLAVDTSPVSTPGVTIPDVTTAPPFTFALAVDAPSAVAVGTLGPGDWKILWFKRVVNPRSNRANPDSFTLHIEGTIHGSASIVARELQVIYSIDPPLQIGFSYVTQTTGLVGTLGIQVKNLDTGDITIAYSTADIVEDAPGHYIATRDNITVPGNYEVFWSTTFPLTLGNFDVGPFTIYDYALQDLGVAVDQIVANLLFSTVDSYAGVTGSVANVLNAILSRDPLNTTVPGSYPLGTAGEALARIASGVVETGPIVSANGGVINLIINRDYFNTDGRGLVFTDSGNNWPSLSGATVTLEVMDESDDRNTALTVVGVANPATGNSKKLTFDVSAAQTTALNPDRPYLFEVHGVLSNGHTVSLVIGKLNAILGA